MNILITGANSYIGTNVGNWLKKNAEFEVETVDTFADNWKKADYKKCDVVFHVAGIAHVNATSKMESLYYKVNCDLPIEIAKYAKKAGVKQFIFMSSMIVFHESRSLKPEVLTKDTEPKPDGVYGNSKLQAEMGLKELECETFKVCVLRPPMIYGPNSKGNFPKLVKLAMKTPLFPAYHNQRSMLYIDNLAEFVKYAIKKGLSGTFYPQNRELADTVYIVRFFARETGHKVRVWAWLNLLVEVGSIFLQPVNKMFATYYYNPEMSQMDFDYQIVSFEESLRRIAESMKTHI